MINLNHLNQRAELLNKVRSFFADRGFLEVETPLAAREAIPERHIRLHKLAGEGRWLQASPEMHHKRLLCAGAGPIFEVTKSFRGHEWGKHHNPEFTLLEWYRPGDDLDAAMALTDELLQTLLGTPSAKRTGYREAFEAAVGIDPHTANTDDLRACVGRLPNLDFHEFTGVDRAEWLDCLLSLQVESTLGQEIPELLYHYPATQSALAATTKDEMGVEVAERFELYFHGVELANGYHELTDPVELRRRLELANQQRLAAGWESIPMPEKLLEAMTNEGLPPCAGVALGLDRLVMLVTGANNLGEVTAFSEYY